MEKMKFVIVGCGRIATVHVPGYKDSEDAVLWGLCDIKRKAAEEFAENAEKVLGYKIERIYDSYDEVLADPEVTAVELIVPHHLHCEYTVKAANAKKHISCQKPMALNIEECDKMIKAAKDNGVMLKVFENFVFYPPYRFAKKLLDDGEIGSPMGIRLKMNNAGLLSRNVPAAGRPSKAEKGHAPVDPDLNVTGWDISSLSWTWRMNETKAGGGPTVFDDGYHKFSTVMYLLGDVEKVSAWIDETTLMPGVINDSPAVIMWKHKDKKLYGVWDVMTSNEMYVESNYYTCDERVEITGSRGVIWVTRCTATMMPKVAPVIMYRDGKMFEYWDMETDWGSSFAASTRDFIDCVKTGREPTLTGERGKDVLKFALAAIDSSKKKTEIFLDQYEDKALLKQKSFVGVMIQNMRKKKKK